MPDRSWIKQRKAQRKLDVRWWCRYCGSRCGANLIVVRYEGRIGLCERCLHRYAMRVGRLDVATYWLRDW